MSSVRQVDIARKVGVSIRAVGFALGDNPAQHRKVSAETRRKIIETAKELGYHPHRSAQMMRKGRTNLIGLLQFGGLVQTNELRELYAAKAIQASGFNTLSTHVHWYADNASEGITNAIHNILQARVEGIVLDAPTEHLSEEHLKLLLAANIPMVALSGTRIQGIPQVRTDVYQGMFDITRHALSLGHRRLVFIGKRGVTEDTIRAHPNFDFLWSSRERVNGFEAAIRESGIPGIEHEVIFSEMESPILTPYDEGKSVMQILLQRSPRPDVIVCSNDRWAIGALSACSQVGVRVPEDIAITGFDNDMITPFTQPPLTTVAQQTKELSTTAVALLLVAIKEKRTVLDGVTKIPALLTIRESCGDLLKHPDDAMQKLIRDGTREELIRGT
ncbi:MAG: LacI family DNA-binding transcriptional regulator [Chthoniobacterales bacterium]